MSHTTGIGKTVSCFLSLLLCIASIQCREKDREAASQPVSDTIMADLKRHYSGKEVEPGVWMIMEDNSVNIFLVLGEKKALLVDTGYGSADLGAYLGSITSQPIMVMNTHGHPDHSGGNRFFEEIRVHKADVQAARSYGHGTPEYIPIREGYVFDLGGRELTVIGLPGHTPGSVAVLDRANRLLFTGDNNNSHIWLFLAESCPLEIYMKSLDRLIARSGEFDTMYIGHGDSYPPSFLATIHTVGAMVLRDGMEGTPYKGFSDAVAYEYEGAILVVDPGKLWK